MAPTIRRRRDVCAMKSVTPPEKAGGAPAAARRRGLRASTPAGTVTVMSWPVVGARTRQARAGPGALRHRHRRRSASSAAPRRRRTTIFEKAAPSPPRRARARASARPELQTRRRAPSTGRCRPPRKPERRRTASVHGDLSRSSQRTSLRCIGRRRRGYVDERSIVVGASNPSAARRAARSSRSRPYRSALHGRAVANLSVSGSCRR